MPGNVIKQCAATNQGSCVFAFLWTWQWFTIQVGPKGNRTNTVSMTYKLMRSNASDDWCRELKSMRSPIVRACRPAWGSGGSDTVFLSPLTPALAEIQCLLKHIITVQRTAGCDITGRTAVTMTSSPQNNTFQVSIIDKLCLNLPEIASQPSRIHLLCGGDQTGCEASVSD